MHHIRDHLEKALPYNRACYFGCFRGASKSVEVVLNSIEAVAVLVFIILKITAPVIRTYRSPHRAVMSCFLNKTVSGPSGLLPPATLGAFFTQGPPNLLFWRHEDFRSPRPQGHDPQPAAKILLSATAGPMRQITDVCEHLYTVYVYTHIHIHIPMYYIHR